MGFTYRSNFNFDENGNPTFDEKRYFYKKNLQGDVIAVYDENGAKCAEYKYDAWGNCTVTKDIDGVAELNPIRYRSYYYDIETDLYYLNSRYYNPEIGRFINADIMLDYRSIHGFNLYSYCYNNPIVYSDPEGHRSVSIREFVEARGGAVVWDSIAECAVFVLNNKTLTIGRFGNNSSGIDSYNYHGRMMAEDYELAYFFRIENWATYFPGFRWYDGSAGDEGEQGFEVITIEDFLNKEFCLDFAQCIIDMRGTKGKYLGNNKKGIAKECYAHAIIKLATNISIPLVNRGYGYNASAREIGYIAKDPNSFYYSIIWALF